MVTVTVLETSDVVVVTVTAGMATVAMLETSGRIEGVAELLGDLPGVSDNDEDEITVAKFDDGVVVAPPVRILTCASPILSSASSKK